MKRGMSVVLGGAGFLGSHLTEALLATGHRVRVFDRENVDLRNLDGVKGPWEFVGGDLGSESDQERAVAGRRISFHLVSTTIPATSNQDPAFDVETNLLATVRLLERARQKIERFVFVSSGRHGLRPAASHSDTRKAIRRSRSSPMVSSSSPSKNISGSTIICTGCRISVVRLSNPYGPRQRAGGAQGAATVFLARVHEGKPIEIWGDGGVIRDYVFVTDAVEGILAAHEHAGTERHLQHRLRGRDEPQRSCDAIKEVTGRQIDVRYTPGRAFDVPANVLDIAHAQRELAWTPRTAFAKDCDAPGTGSTRMRES